MRYELVQEEMSRMSDEDECQQDLQLLLSWSHAQRTPGMWPVDEEPDEVRAARERLHYRKQLAHYRAGVRFQAALEAWRHRALHIAMAGRYGPPPVAMRTSMFGETALAYDHPPIVCDATWKPVLLLMMEAGE